MATMATAPTPRAGRSDAAAGCGLFKTFNAVGLAVSKATGGQQLPWVSSSPISGNFYFAGKPEPAAAGRAAGTGHPTRPVQDSPLLAAGRSAAARSRHRLRPAGGDAHDTGHAPDLPGVEVERINVAAATAACNEAMRVILKWPRFVFEAGRAPTARKDYAEARRLYDKAASAGYAMAMNNSAASTKAARAS